MRAFKMLFTTYGEAAYNAQLIEYDLVTIWMLDSIHQGVSVSQSDLLRFQQDWSEKTLGQLLRPLCKSNLITEEIREFLEKVRKTRNKLAHSFFVRKGIDLGTKLGREAALAELNQMKAVLQLGEEFFSSILDTYLKDFGVDAEEIRRRIRQDIEFRDGV